MFFIMNCVLKKYSSQCINLTRRKSFFVTTPIFYVNAAPHIGHLYSAVIADAVQRWHRMFESNLEVVFSTGTDEHGTKIQQSASNHNVHLKNYCDSISQDYRTLFDQCNVEYTDFIRTTDENHKRAVRHFWNKLEDGGHVYSAQYKGWYCVQDETFLTESQLKEIQVSDGRTVKVSLESGHPVEWTEEQNFMFRLSSFQDELVRWFQTHERSVLPGKFRDILLKWLSETSLPDVSISRPASRVHWGIHVPGNEDQTVYVWLDALVNYLTIAGYPDVNGTRFKKSWPPDVQVIGKDILKFHGIYWPAFLMAVDLEPPKMLFCHSHWTVDGEKMSKSKGNVVTPSNTFKTYTAEGLRYFLLREGVAHSDGNYSDTKVMRVLNAELADTLGNLLSRCCGLALNPRQVFPAINEHEFEELCRHDVVRMLVDSVEALPGTARAHYTEYNFYRAVDSVISVLHAANLFFETMRPWLMKKDPTMATRLDTVLHITMETLRVCGITLQPIIPCYADALLDKLSVEKHLRTWQDSNGVSWKCCDRSVEKSIGNGATVLFKRIVVDDESKTTTDSVKKGKKRKKT